MTTPVPTAGGSPGGASGPTSTAPNLQPPTRRNTELLLLAFAAFMVTLSLVLVEGNQEQAITMEVGYYGLAFLVLFGAAHLAVRRWAPYADPLILPCAALLNGLGLVMIHRIDLAKIESTLRRGKTVWEPEAPQQVVWTALGLVLFVAILLVVKNHRTLAKLGYTFGLAGLVALALPGILPAPLSRPVNGAKIWLQFGFASIQPGEFAKIMLMIFFASFLVAKRDLFTAAGRRFLGMDLPRARDLGPIIAAWLVSIGVLVLERDLGSSLLFFGIVLVMLYIATERAAWVVLGLSLFVGGCLVAYQLFSHVQIRVANWLHPLHDVYDKSLQVAQALFGLATGGLFGTGLGNGRPDLVPEAQTDYITAALGEELGFVGLAAILLLYGLLALRGLRSALAVRDSFGKLLGAGLSFAVCLQVFVVVGGVTTLIPVTGLTAPFLSKGGSSLLANYILIALLLRISDAARRPQPTSKPKRPPQPAIADQSTVMVERPS
ncbi:FtsW/RodA/SpoVE family cell cycle protein [Goodfellowiella coeruleoviolacea]|uniref:Cell elongation-specific peptidoglycan biosynthesis regulator RodA n=1 Tax=Goodfellowiella coeruleoviolacea TaxID=334858 RepID=A0AAE3GIT2_9PSEU|nr:FtsW/RodA/SpoVE family cell cycle protein [Goodfellowiella coeruleoviolacea]MCP2168992.1 cell elongation-specific peptidoglycan biosynthesis regulator RodA [Goodfellowiella coeruleoviolacea]